MIPTGLAEEIARLHRKRDVRITRPPAATPTEAALWLSEWRPERNSTERPWMNGSDPAASLTACMVAGERLMFLRWLMDGGEVDG